MHLQILIAAEQDLLLLIVAFLAHPSFIAMHHGSGSIRTGRAVYLTCIPGGG
jgi:hypothetical protein